MTILELIGKLEGVKETRSGWIAKCPAHDDRVQSLTLCVGQKVSILARCHAGCRFFDIIAAVSKKDLLRETRDASR